MGAVRPIVKAVLAVSLIGTTCAVVMWRPDVLTGEGLTLLSTLSGAVIAHYFMRDADAQK